MSKNRLDLYLSRVAAGDKEFVDRLCQQLADRMLIVPLVSERNDAGEATKVVVMRVEKDGNSLVLGFTNAQRYQSWCERRGETPENLEMLGSDFCSALDLDAWLWIDPGSEHSLSLAPHIVDKIALAGTEEEAAEEELPAPLNRGAAPETVERAPADDREAYPENAEDAEEYEETEVAVPQANSDDEPFDDLESEEALEGSEFEVYVEETEPANRYKGDIDGGEDRRYVVDDMPAPQSSSPGVSGGGKKPSLLDPDDEEDFQSVGHAEASAQGEYATGEFERPDLTSPPKEEEMTRSRGAASKQKPAVKKNLLDVDEDELPYGRNREIVGPGARPPEPPKKSWKDWFKRR